jgi:hypothetical protein
LKTALALRFGLELCLLAAVAYWGSQACSGTVVHVVLAIAAPTIVAVVWGLFVSPKARVRLPRPLWLLLQLVLFGLGAAALIAAGQVTPGVILVPTAFVNLAVLLALDR